MIHDDKPPLEELALEHHGVKGMKWGVRRTRYKNMSTSEKRSYSAKRVAKSKQRKAFAKEVGKSAAKTLVVAGGAAAALYLLDKHGSKTVASQVSADKLTTAFRRGQDFASNGLNQHYRPGSHAETMAFRRGQDFASRAMAQEDWSRKVSELSKSIADANKSADQWLIKNGMGMARTAIA